jgi:DNA-binding XRE family transcriptional regulator
MTPLRTLRLAHGYLKQETFANKCHVAESHLCALELGTKKPSEDLARTIAERLGEPVEKVFPEGFAVRVKHYNKHGATPRSDDGTGYVPVVAPARPAIRFPRHPFTVLCYRCQNHVPMRADDAHSPEDEDPRCPECGARFYQIVPLEEAHV